MPDASELSTIELPWLQNEKSISCIPEGQYNLKYVYSPKITQITHGRFTGGWEITMVAGRTHILIHPGNWPSQLQGCIGVGEKLNLMKDPETDCPYGVANSQATFTKFMRALKKDGDYKIVITAKHAVFL